MKRVLVTGGGGFVGKAILKRLANQGIELVSLARGDYPELRALGVETHRGDLADKDAVMKAVAGCDVVFHVAALAGIWGAYETFYRANVLGTEHVIEACRAHGVKRLVFTSSPSVVQTDGDCEGGDESLPYPPSHRTYYQATKAASEQAVLAANDAQLSTVALRPRLIWGPGDRHLVPRLVDRAKKGRLRFLGSGDYLVDSTLIDNVVDVHLAAAERLAPGAACAGKAYFISNGEPWPLDKLLNGILKARGVAPVRKRIPAGLAFAIGMICEGIWWLFRLGGEPPMTRFLARQLSTANWYDLSAARRDLGYEPRVSLDDGLKLLAEEPKE
ncbi:MAG TPA: 3-beta hydroxysteroid dehydrogenase [Myxococcales bacterium]|nr:3-beta hydroxysteroid dehydrogenase [Myxococcales bacterium]